VANHSTLREDLYVVFEGLNADSEHPVIKIIINPLVNWIWIGVLVIVLGTGMALVPNAAPVSVPVRSAVAVSQMDEQGMHPAGAGK
jgi:cytochrome c-type biogenesis protein CcmF